MKPEPCDVELVSRVRRIDHFPAHQRRNEVGSNDLKRVQTIATSPTSSAGRCEAYVAMLGRPRALYYVAHLHHEETGDGHSFDRQFLALWHEHSRSHPVTGSGGTVRTDLVCSPARAEAPRQRGASVSKELVLARRTHGRLGSLTIAPANTAPTVNRMICAEKMNYR